MPQLSVSDAPAIALRGQLAEPGAPKFARSFRAEGASVSAGLPVKRGTLPAKQVTPFASTDVPNAQTFAGVVILETSRAYDEAAIEDGDSVAVLREGSIYMDFSAAVSAGQAVKMTMATGALEGMAEGSDPGAGKCQLPGLRIAETTSASGLAIVEVALRGFAALDSSADADALVRVSNIPIGGVARASIGTDGASVAGTVYFSELFLPASKSVTGVGLLNGTVVGTDNVIAAIFDEAGIRLGTSALAGTLGAGGDAFQELPLTAALSLPRGRYWIALQVSGTTHAHQRIAANTYLNATGSVAGVFGTIPSTITPTTSTTADVGPIGYLY